MRANQNDEPCERMELEKTLGARVTFSRQRLDLYSVHVKQIQELTADIPAPDGGSGLQHALRAERAALSEYVRVLRIYSDLVVYGTAPKEDADSSVGP